MRSSLELATSNVGTITLLRKTFAYAVVLASRPMKKESKGKGSAITGKLLGEIFHTLLLILSRAATNDFAVFLEEAHALAFAVFLEETHALAFAKEEARALAFAVFASFLRRYCKGSSEILFLREK